MKITIEIKENKGNLTVKVNELKRLKNTKDSEFNGAINIYNAICNTLKEMEGKK
jgi:hypothetical protein